ncbi:MAG: hypothetical protein ACOCX2_11155 [Armatimonadota bacterium]
MLKAELETLAGEQEEQIEAMEAQIADLTEKLEDVTGERDRLDKAVGALQEQIATSEAVTAQPQTHAELREYFEALIGALAPLRPMMPRAIAPALDALARSLRGRWPDEKDVDRERIRRVNALLED